MYRRIAFLLLGAGCAFFLTSFLGIWPDPNRLGRCQIVRVGKPLEELPNYIHVPDDEVSMYADFESKTNMGVTVYVVNRTREPIEFAAAWERDDIGIHL